MSSADPTRRRAGFTLIELLIALLIGGILMTVVFQMISGQSRVVAVQGQREESQQNVRGALEVISADLRGVFPEGVVEAQDRQITFMQPRAWGVVCGSGATSIDALFPIVPNAPLPTASEAAGVLVNASGPTAPSAWRPALPARASVADVTVLAGGPTAGLCNNSGAAGQVQVIQIETDNLTAAAAVPGNQIVVYDMTRYDIAEGDDGWWIRRSLGMDAGAYNMQPLAGPAEADGLGFSYFVDSGDAPIAAPGTSTADLATIRMISVQAMTRSSQELNGHAQRDSGSVRIMLRN